MTDYKTINEISAEITDLRARLELAARDDTPFATTIKILSLLLDLTEALRNATR